MIKLSKPFIPEEAIERAVSILRSGNLVQGECVKEFETELCEYLNIKHAVLVSNGTAALHLALICLGVKSGDEVIVPAFTYPATANVVEIVGATTVMVDINLDDFCINTSEIESKITEKTSAIIPVHEFGQSAKMDEIVSIAKKYNIDIIEDAACALGTEFNNQKVGTFGKIGCFSLHPRKAITTGEGGIIVTDDDEIADKLRSHRNHGIKINESGKFDFKYAGLNYRITDFQAALGLSQLKMIDQIIERRIEIAAQYHKKLSEVDWLIKPKDFINRKMVYQTYHALVGRGKDRDRFIKYLWNHNIETNFGAYALNSLDYYKNKYGLEDSSMPKAFSAYKCGLALPLSYDLSETDLTHVIEKIKNY